MCVLPISDSQNNKFEKVEKGVFKSRKKHLGSEEKGESRKKDDSETAIRGNKVQKKIYKWEKSQGSASWMSSIY